MPAYPSSPRQPPTHLRSPQAELISSAPDVLYSSCHATDILCSQHDLHIGDLSSELPQQLPQVFIHAGDSISIPEFFAKPWEEKKRWITELTLARSRSACFRCLQKVTEERECGRITGSPWTSSFTKTLKTMTPFTSHRRSVGIIQSNQPPEPKEGHLSGILVEQPGN